MSHLTCFPSVPRDEKLHAMTGRTNMFMIKWELEMCDVTFTESRWCISINFFKIAFKVDFSTLSSWLTPPTWQLQRSLTEMFCTLQYSETRCPQVDFLFTRWSPLPQYTVILIYSLLWWCTGDWELKLSYIRSMLMANTSLLYQLTNKYLWLHLGVEYTVSYFNHARRRYIVQHDCLEKC